MNWHKYVAEASKTGEITKLYTDDDPKAIAEFARTHMEKGWIVQMQKPKVVRLKKNWKPQDILMDAVSRGAKK